MAVRRINRRILDTPLEPPSKEWLWLHMNNGVPSLDWYVNGKWTSVAQGSPIQSVPKENYVTLNALQVRLQSYVSLSSFNNTLADYAKKAEVPTQQWVTGLLSGYQKTLSAGTGIKITNNQVSINLNAGSGISILGNTISCTVPSGTPPDLTSLIERVEALENAGYIPSSWFKTINYVDLFNDPDTNPDVDMNIEANGTGTGSTIHIAQEGESTNNVNTLYFFTHSRLQGVGLYNTLLQNGSLTGSDGVTYTYHPGKFYHLYDDGSFIELPATNDRFADCNPGGNAIYYNFRDKSGHKQRVLTTMEKYGSIIIPHKIQYAETSDTVYYSLQVKGPFFAEYTDVKLVFNGDELQALLVTNPTGSNPYTEIQPNGTIRFTYSDYYVTRYLLFKRKYNQLNELGTAKDIHVVFNNGHKDVDVTLKYGSVRIFYKDGIEYSGFDTSTWAASKHRKTATNFSLQLGGRATFMSNVQVYQSKLNVLYAKVCAKVPERYSGDVFNGLILAAFRNGWNCHAANPNAYFQTTESRGTNNCAQAYDCWASAVITCQMKEVRAYFNDSKDSDLITLSSLAFYQKTTDNGWWTISEVGLIEHEDPFTE